MDRVTIISKDIENKIIQYEEEINNNNKQKHGLRKKKLYLINKLNNVQKTIDELNLSKQKIEESPKKLKMLKIAGIILTIISSITIGVIASVGFKIMNIMSILESFILGGCCGLLYSPIATIIEFKEYTRLKEFVENNNLDNILKKLEKNNKEYDLTLKEKLTNDNAIAELNSKNTQLNNEISKLKQKLQNIINIKEEIINDCYKDINDKEISTKSAQKVLKK